MFTYYKKSLVELLCCVRKVAANVSGVYEVGEFEIRQLVNLPKENSSTKAECLVVSPNLINTLLAVAAVFQG